MGLLFIIEFFKVFFFIHLFIYVWTSMTFKAVNINSFMFNMHASDINKLIYTQYFVVIYFIRNERSIYILTTKETNIYTCFAHYSPTA